MKTTGSVVLQLHHWIDKGDIFATDPDHNRVLPAKGQFKLYNCLNKLSWITKLSISNSSESRLILEDFILQLQRCIYCFVLFSVVFAVLEEHWCCVF